MKIKSFCKSSCDSDISYHTSQHLDAALLFFTLSLRPPACRVFFAKSEHGLTNSVCLFLFRLYFFFFFSNSLTNCKIHIFFSPSASFVDQRRAVKDFHQCLITQFFFLYGMSETYKLSSKYRQSLGFFVGFFPPPSGEEAAG